MVLSSSDHSSSSLPYTFRNGWLSGAIIDVTEPEPLPKESKLWTMPEVSIAVVVTLTLVILIETHNTNVHPGYA